MTRLNKKFLLTGLLICGSFLICQTAAAQTALSSAAPKERARVVLSTELPHLDGDHLKAILVEVNYGPGESLLPIPIRARFWGMSRPEAFEPSCKDSPKRSTSRARASTSLRMALISSRPMQAPWNRQSLLPT